MILLFFIVIGFIVLSSLVYGFVERNAFAFGLGAVGLLIFAALLQSGVEVENGIQKAGDQYPTLYQTLTPDNDFTVMALYWFSLCLGIFSLGYLLMEFAGAITEHYEA